MYNIHVLNNIVAQGLQQFPGELYTTECVLEEADAILLRSYKLHKATFPETLSAVARAGAGVNNIPVDQLTRLGVPVFNTPGANANAVKELVLAGLLIACRNIYPAWSYAQTLRGSDEEINQLVEQQKKQFVGTELSGKTLAVIGLGAIGVQVANAAVDLGLRVIGYDPVITVQRAWQLSAAVSKADSLQQAMAAADFITVHVPYSEKTHHLINSQTIAYAKPEAVLLNFSRAEVVDAAAVLHALDAHALCTYVSDFPTAALLAHSSVICLPHLGASTAQAEQNCAVMAVNSLRNYLENGGIINSVNFPTINLPRNAGHRLAIVNSNVPNMVGQISTVLAKAELNILDMVNASRGDVAYTLIDVDQPIEPTLLTELEQIAGVLKTRVVPSRPLSQSIADLQGAR